METFLNFLWVLIALTAVGFWRLSWRREARRAAHNPIAEWAAFTCVLVFLFYAVSMSDDLHADLLIFDECSSGRRQLAALICAHPSHDGAKVVAAPGAVLSARVSPYDPLGITGAIAKQEPHSVSLIASHAASGRAPPISYL